MWRTKLALRSCKVLVKIFSSFPIHFLRVQLTWYGVTWTWILMPENNYHVTRFIFKIFIIYIENRKGTLWSRGWTSFSYFHSNDSFYSSKAYLMMIKFVRALHLSPKCYWNQHDQHLKNTFRLFEKPLPNLLDWNYFEGGETHAQTDSILHNLYWSQLIWNGAESKF